VTRDDAAPSFWQRALHASWPLPRVFGVELRVHWTVVLVPVALFGHFATSFAVIRRIGDVPVDWWSDVLRPWREAATWALAWTVAFYFTVWLHEMAHAKTAARFGVAVRRVALSPFGGLVHSAPALPDARAEFWTAFAGPAVHVAAAALLAAPWRLFDIDELANAASRAGAVGFDRWPQMYGPFVVLQLAFAAVNLLPVYPLDGGRCLRGALATRLVPAEAARWTTYVGYPGAIMLSILGMWMLVNVKNATTTTELVAVALIAVGLTGFMHCRSLQIEAQDEQSVSLPANAARAAGETEPWTETIAESERLARAEDRRERRAAEARRQEELQRGRIQERIDQLLDRINEVGGVENLTPAERRELAEASESLRRETAGR